MATYNIYEAKTNFSRLIEEAVQGEQVVIAKAGQPLIRMVPIVLKQAGPRRKFGDNFLGITRVSQDAYDDLPLSSFEVLRDEENPRS